METAHFLAGEVKDEWRWKVEMGEQIMSELACVPRISLNESSGKIVSTLILDGCTLYLIYKHVLHS